VSPKAQANAKPYLEIYADDVQCNHGVTVGQLDEDALFYMRCRGIPTEAARRLLMRAYADEILKEVGVEALRGWLDSLVRKRFNGQLQACQDCVLACPERTC
ncbi:MAG: SufD family Fe-S cluster assembly protein, partial [Bacteroidales bacterium]|nr:SufD family Fe-S cluster assembly protein [Bacteroidales bacterium]